MFLKQGDIISSWNLNNFPLLDSFSVLLCLLLLVADTALHHCLDWLCLVDFIDWELGTSTDFQRILGIYESGCSRVPKYESTLLGMVENCN
jgi:hypothetical protein